MTKLKELTKENFLEIKTLFKAVFTAPPWNDDWSNDAQLTEYLEDLMGARTPLTLGLYDDDVLVGLSLGYIKHWYGGTEYIIDELCIKTSEQGKGLGTEFFSLIEQHLSEREIKHIFLMTERDVPAYEFYKKIGFDEMTTHVCFAKSIREGKDFGKA